MTASPISATPLADAARDLPPTPSRALEHADVRGESGWPLIGHSFGILFRTQATIDRLRERHGLDFRMQAFGVPFLVVGSPDAVRDVLLDREKNFSSSRGWGDSIGELFARGLMLLDFEEHRLDRRIMQVAFRADAMRRYVGMMDTPIREAVARVPRRVLFYPWIKQLTLELASRVFLGLTLGAHSTRIDRAFTDAVAASIAIVKREVPGLAYARGMRGRRVLEHYFCELVADRRGAPADDLLSELCRAEGERGERFADQAIVDHMIFLLMAAHDTTTSALATVVHCLIADAGWQERVRDEIRARGGAAMTWEERDALPSVDLVFDEALRLYPPVPFINRRSVRACTLAGMEVPANTIVTASALVTHRSPAYWLRPERFEPERFAPPRSEHTRHTHAYFPFGGGAHACLGMHFARIQVKAVLAELLLRHRVRAPSLKRRERFSMIPIPHPHAGLPVVLEPT